MNKLRELIDEPGFVLMILGFIFFMTLILTTPASGQLTMKDIKDQQADLIVKHCTTTTMSLFVLDIDNSTACILINLYAMQRVLNFYKDLSFEHFDHPKKDHPKLKKLKQLMGMNVRKVGGEESLDYVSILDEYEAYLESRKSK